ncbi:hypothetical protein Nepgr_032333 [Nepenthes gracilis]|uniref:Peptidase M14 carboxypeptidase A domain-containing protein n=1 Tax=Nepenthes gracilis TaxID=150966 RepID=A0AAD3TJ33_NEPGR|nr:hypothetical protein Nepgr_032333 [Nepenthes gracilis]
MSKLAISFEPHVWVNVHSGTEAFFMSYDHKNTTPYGLLADSMKSMLKVLNHRHFQDRCMIGSGEGSVVSKTCGLGKEAIAEYCLDPPSLNIKNKVLLMEMIILWA